MYNSRVPWSNGIVSAAKPVVNTIGKLATTAEETVYSIIHEKIPEIRKKIEKKTPRVVRKYVSKGLNKVESKDSTTVSNVESKVSDTASSSVEKASREIRNQVDSCKKAVQGVKSGVNIVEKQIGTVDKLSKTVKVPIKTLEAAVKVIKALPLPQLKLPVSFTVIQSDTLEFLMGLIEQAKEQSEALTVNVNVLEGYLKNVSKTLDDADSLLASLESYLAITDNASNDDVERLESAGILDEEGNVLFSKILDAASENREFILWGNLERNSLSDPKASVQDVSNDLSYASDVEIENRVKLGKIGDTFTWEDREVAILDPNNIDKPFGIIPVSSYVTMSKVSLQRLSTLVLSKQLREALKNLTYTPLVDTYAATKSSNSVKYVSATGAVYTLEVKIDTKTPSIASRHYVEARDESGVVVLEGPPTFSLNTENLIKDMQVRLDSITL